MTICPAFLETRPSPDRISRFFKPTSKKTYSKVYPDLFELGQIGHEFFDVVFGDRAGFRVGKIRH